MKKVIRNSFVLLALALIFSAASVRDASAQGPLGQILARLDSHNKALKSVEADVTMLKFNPQLNVEDKYTGATSYLPNANGRRYMRLDWKTPAVEQIYVIGDEYKLYKPSINTVYVGNVKSAKSSAGAGNALGFMNMSREQLRSNYNVVYLGEENAAGALTAHLQLTPKAATSYKSSELWVDGNGMPVQAKILEMNNDTTTVTLTNIRKNVGINASIFNFKTPNGAKILKP